MIMRSMTRALLLSEEFAAAARFVRGFDRAALLLALLMVVAFCIWLLLGAAYPAAVFASPYETAEALYWVLSDRRNDYIDSIGDTLVVFGTGYALSIVAAVFLSLIMGLFSLLGWALNPCLDLLASVPNIAFMPMVVALMGLGHPAKITVVFLAAMIPMAINCHAALRQVSPTYEQAALSLGATRLKAHLLVTWHRVDATTMSIGQFMAMPDRTGLKILVDAKSYFAAVPIVSKVNVVSTSVLKGRARDLEAVLEALTRASRDFATNPSSWIDAMARARPDVQRSALEALAPVYVQSWSVNGGLQRKELDETQAWLYQKEKYSNSDLVIPGKWQDFEPIDHFLQKLGPWDTSDQVWRGRVALTKLA